MNIKVSTKKTPKERRQVNQVRKSRLIVRNLSFKTTEDEIRSAFATYGTLNEVNMPKKEDGQFRGFAFISYDNPSSSLKAIENLNGKKIGERTVAVDFSLAKTEYDKAMEEKKNTPPVVEKKEAKKETVKTEEDSEIRKKKNRKKKLKQRAAKKAKKDAALTTKIEVVDDDDDDDDDEANDDDLNDDDMEEDASNKKDEKKPRKPKKDDVSEGRTVFIRNLDLDTTEDSVAEVFKQFGDIVYCKICMNPYTEKSKGTAFVLYKSKEGADKCLREAENPNNAAFYVDGQQLLVSLALDRNRLTALEEEKRNQHKDKRNLYLAKEGLIYPNSPAAVGVSQQDLKKRLELEERKRKFLQNLHYFISNRRLCVHNIPADYTDKKLHDVFLAAAEDKTAKVLWARIMRNRSKQDNKFGSSKGFAFVEFNEHYHALKALRFLNNNPDIWDPERRPIVEFAVENKVAVNIKKFREIAYEKKKDDVKMKATNSAQQQQQQQEEGEQEDGQKKKKKNKGRKKSRNERVAGQKARAAVEQAQNGSAESNGTDAANGEKADVDYSGVQSKPVAGKVAAPKMNRKMGIVKEDLLNKKKLDKREKRKLILKKKHMVNLEKKKEKKEEVEKVLSKRFREEEDDHIDKHFQKRKRAFLDV